MRQAIAETHHAMRVLAEAGLHPEAVAHLEQAREASQRALHGWFGQSEHIVQAIAAHKHARAELVY